LAGVTGTRTWRCLEASRPAVWTASSGRPRTVARAVIRNLGLASAYAFVRIPLGTGERAEVASDFWDDNWIWVLVGAFSLSILMFLVIYICMRLYRYRKKYHEEREKVYDMEDQVQDLETMGAAAIGIGDEDDVEMMPNPMVVRMNVIQSRLGQIDGETAKNELEDLRQMSAQESAARQARIQELNLERAALANELDNLREELQLEKNLQSRQRDTLASSGVEQGRTGPAASTTSSIRQEFGQVAPKQKSRQ